MITFPNRTIADCLRKGAREVLVETPTEFQQCVAVLELVDMFKVESGDIWVAMPADAPGPRVIPLRSRALRNFVSEVFRQFIGHPPKDHPIKRAIVEHETRCTYGNFWTYGTVNHRVEFLEAPTSDVYPESQSVTIDVADRDHNAINISAEGAEVFDGQYNNWLRPPASRPLTMPRPPKSVKKLLRRLRHLIKPASERDFHRILVWLSATLNPNGPRPALVLDGPRSATLNTARFLRSILDPSEEWRNDFPTSETQLRKLAINNYIVVFPGLQRLSPKRAETLCRLVHDYRRSAIVILHRSREDRPAVMDPELERSSLTVRLSEESCPIEELKLQKHLNQSVAEMG
jgi:hypothetical protein